MAPLWTPVGRAGSRLMLNKRFSRVAITFLCAIIVGILLFWQRIHGEYHPEFYPFATTSYFHPVSIDPTGMTTKELCATFPRHLINSIQPVLKMGHGEKRSKIDAQLDSVSACFEKDDLLVFSDLGEEIGGHKVIDILADLPSNYYVDNPDFNNYIWQKEMRDNGTLDKDEKATAAINGWIVDKYKFLPMIERAWRTKPNKDFYFFLETDTYVFWDNAFRFLHTFNPDAPLYMGSPSPGIHDQKKDIMTWFANGGPGFVLSRGAIKALLHTRKNTPFGQYLEPPVTEKWLPLLRRDCCGDSVLGWAMWNVSVPLQGYWPLFNPHPLHGIPFSESYWCQPVVTLHKSFPEDMMDLWRWEFAERQLGRPLLYADLFRFQHPGKLTELENWDNDFGSAVAPPEAKVDSFEACAKYCEKQPKCLQFSWRGLDGPLCRYMSAIRLGQARPPEIFPWPEERDKDGNVIPPPPDRKDRWVNFKSGWVPGRIEEWIAAQNCSTVQWVGPSIKRIF